MDSCRADVKGEPSKVDILTLLPQPLRLAFFSSVVLRFSTRAVDFSLGASQQQRQHTVEEA